MNGRKIALLLALVLIVVAGIALIPRDLLTLSALQQYQSSAAAWYQANPLLAATLYSVVYVLVTALSIPGATLLTLLGGAVFPFWQAVLIVSFASTLGALLAMLASRYLFADAVASRFPAQMRAVNAGMARDGAYYLFALRLMPLFPFFVINLLAGVTRIGLARYWWVSQLGMLPATLIYLNAGRQTRQLHSLHDIVSPGILLAFALIGLLPLASRWLVTRFFHR